jgi:hypothetical protein
MGYRVQGIDAQMMNSVLTALHGPILGPETAYAAITFESPNTDNPDLVRYKFERHAQDLRFADDADTLANRLKQHRPIEDIDLLVATVPLADATERMHDTIRELVVNSHQRVCSVETHVILPLMINVRQLRTADSRATRNNSWRALRATIRSGEIVRFLETTNDYLHHADDLSRKRRVIFGARPDTGPNTPHFQIVREFLHNIRNGLSGFTTELTMLKEALEGIRADAPDADSFGTEVARLGNRIEKWYTAYGSAILTLHRYFIFDGLEKTNRQMATFSVETLAQAAAADSPSLLAEAKLNLVADDNRQRYVKSLQLQHDELLTLRENIAAWHRNFDIRFPNTSSITSQAQLLTEKTRRAIDILSKLINSIPIGRITEEMLRQFYINVGEFKAIGIEMPLGFDGWNSRREAHMELPY